MAPPTLVKGVLWTLMVTCACAASQEEPREVPIIKQINRVNDDGTYTFGYEAADGSFKIETRDVLGNVKGMFGYIDEQGQLKRVSYTANNGTGFQATGNIPGITDGGVTRRPVLVYRGLNRPVTERNEDDEGSTTPSYGDYINGRRGYITTTTEEPTTRPPLRVLVTKRPIIENRNPNVIRRQLDRERDDYTPRRIHYQPVGPDPREVYRNLLLEQNNLKPDPPRTRYYSPIDQEYPETTMHASPRYAPPPPPPLPPVPRYRVYDEQYPVPDRRFPVPAQRPYDDYLPPPPDYEAFRAAMNYLLQYLQYMRRMDPYPPYPYPADPYNPRPRPPFYPPPRLPPVSPVPPVPFPLPTPYPTANVPYINPNVQYSTGRENAQEALASLKARMDNSDQSDSGDTRPPSSALIRMLLARPNITQRPTAIRSVEILGTASSTTSTTTENPDVMEASS
ncbi:uncharacterized protein [Halyomorpha halys]|uniref:uncharacterized protein n=1 Tax=Halyomorpha halys TaxID=286706 RepID=UPI0006D51F0B|nr:pollen-specific leucine-rich repeat extensin-like protein 1 [Halyomorpha halys]